MSTPTIPGLPAGYTLETPQAAPASSTPASSGPAAVEGLPAGYTLETPTDNTASEVAHDARIASKPYSGAVSGSKVPDSILNAPDSVGDTVAGITGLGAVGTAAGAAIDPLVDPAVQAVSQYFGKIKAIMKLAAPLGLDVGWKEARDLYREFSSDKK